MLYRIEQDLDMQTGDDGQLYLARQGRHYALSLTQGETEVEVRLDAADLLRLALQATALVAADEHTS